MDIKVNDEIIELATKEAVTKAVKEGLSDYLKLQKKAPCFSWGRMSRREARIRTYTGLP